MKKRQAATLFIMIAMCIAISGSLPGCGKKEETDKQAKGRYTEEMIELPVQNGERGVGLLELQEGGMKIYTKLSGEEHYKAYESSDGKSFTECSADWLNNAAASEEYYLKDVIEGEDGNEYALYLTGGEVHVIKTADGVKAEEVLPEVFKDKIAVDTIRVMENGDIAAFSNTDGKTEIYSAADGSKIGTLENGGNDVADMKTFDCKDGKAIALSKEHSGFDIFDVEQAKVVQEITCENFNSDAGLLKFGDQDDCYYLDRSGLYHMSNSGSTLETLLEGNAASMGDQSMMALGIGTGDNDDLYILYNGDGKGAVLAHYAYDKDAAATAENQLTIYGLKDNSTIRQAANKFQAKHPDTQINFRTGSEGEGVTSKADQIRVLNTELLSGNGADILILDGMPVNSYIEKGVLEDLTDFYGKLSKDDKLLDNVMESMKTDGRIYEMPVRTHILCMYGDAEYVKALGSLDALEEFLKSGSGKEMLPARSYEQNLKMLMTINYKELFAGEGRKGVDEKALKKLLETTKELCDNTGVTAATIEEEYQNMNGQSVDDAREEMGDDVVDSLTTDNGMDVGKKPQAVFKEASGVTDLMIEADAMEKYNITPEGVNGLYLPKGMAGINKSSENKELAKEFLQTLFSEEIQSQDLYDGFPVNKAAVDAWCAKEPSEEDSMVAVIDGEGGNVKNYHEPTGEQLRAFTEIGAKADTAVRIDDAVMEMIVNEGTAYYKGDKTLEETVKNIGNKVETYLAE